MSKHTFTFFKLNNLSYNFIMSYLFNLQIVINLFQVQKW